MRTAYWSRWNDHGDTSISLSIVSRIKTSLGDVVNVAVPWVRANSGFTLLFEALALAMIEREMPVNHV